MKWFVHQREISPNNDNVKDSSHSPVDMTTAEESSSHGRSLLSTLQREKSRWEKKLKEFCDDENVNFEKWLTLKSIQVAFFGQTTLDLMTRIALDKAKQRNVNGILANNIAVGMRKCLTKSVFSGAIMAANVGCMMASVTQFTTWRGYFSLWTVPCASTVVPVMFSYFLGVKPLQAMKSGLMLGSWSSLAIFAASVFYDLSINETYQRLKNDVEVELKKERESELYKFMKEHHIRSKWFGKWMMNRSRIDGCSDDEFS